MADTMDPNDKRYTQEIPEGDLEILREMTRYEGVAENIHALCKICSHPRLSHAQMGLTCSSWDIGPEGLVTMCVCGGFVADDRASECAP